MPRSQRPDRTVKRHRLIRSRRIGLLGGSFNPAHEGHVHISQQAIKALRLDEIWWLVAPENPFKDKSTLAPYADRLAGAAAMTEDCPHVYVSDFESAIRSYRTVTTLRALKKTMPHVEFIWIAGMDLIHQMHNWQGFDEIAATLPLAFFERPPLDQGTKRSLLGLNPKIRQIRNARPGQKTRKTPCISIFRRRHTVNQSATALRQAAKPAKVA